MTSTQQLELSSFAAVLVKAERVLADKTLEDNPLFPFATVKPPVASKTSTLSAGCGRRAATWTCNGHG